MLESANAGTRAIIHRTRGRRHGPITRLVSPGDLGALIKPFVFLDFFEIPAESKGGFGYHPHSGIATVTVLFEGGVAYEDSTGKSGTLDAGSVEWMQAGGGVWHTGSPIGAGRGYQLWLALPAALENAAPESVYLPAESVPASGPARVILGRYGEAVSGLPEVSPMTYLHVRLEDGEAWRFAPQPGHDVAWVAVDEGVLETSGAELSSEIAVFENGTGPIDFRARGNVNFMLGAAALHPYPLITGYYSVHTSEAALQTGEAGIEVAGTKLRAAGKI